MQQPASVEVYLQEFGRAGRAARLPSRIFTPAAEGSISPLSIARSVSLSATCQSPFPSFMRFPVPAKIEEVLSPRELVGVKRRGNGHRQGLVAAVERRSCAWTSCERIQDTVTQASSGVIATVAANGFACRQNECASRGTRCSSGASLRSNRSSPLGVDEQ